MLFPDVTYLSIEVDEAGLQTLLTSCELTAWIFGTQKEGAGEPELEAERLYERDPLPEEWGDMREVLEHEYDAYRRYIPKCQWVDGQFLFPIPEAEHVTDEEWRALAERASRLPRGELKSFKLIKTSTQILAEKELA